MFTTEIGNCKWKMVPTVITFHPCIGIMLQPWATRLKKKAKAVDANNWSKTVAGVYGFENGHILLWTNKLNPEVSPIFQQKERLIAEFGEERAGFMVNMTRNLDCIPMCS